MKKYSWLIPLSLFSVLLIIARVVYTSSLMFSFLVWNIFLAAVPLYFSLKALNSNRKLTTTIYSALWLLFFPNSMYIITDLFHLMPRENVPLWFDLLILFSSATNGVLFGFLSLSNMEKTFKKFSSSRMRHVLVLFIMLLCGYGIYLGRFERWNSWDIIAQPYMLSISVMHDIVHPVRNINTWALSLSFGIWMFLLYRFVQKIRLH
ncbi:MAG: DUF1361 domain-containing protein [Chitinophagales bacterium]|nr:DUF1361 domain-containing protein [Chitinophagales bacterium]